MRGKLGENDIEEWYKNKEFLNFMLLECIGIPATAAIGVIIWINL